MALIPASTFAETEELDGLRLTPEISWSEGNHRFALHFNSRLRWERWEALTNSEDNIYLFGGKVLSRNPTLSDDDVNWAFFQVALSY